MKILLSIIAVTFSIFAHADDLSNRISTGMNKSEVAFIMGGAPDSEECTTALGIQKCSLIWKKGLLSKTIYSVTTIADKVVSVSVQSGTITGF